MSEQRVSVRVDVLNKVLAVLGNMPYQQVANVIGELQEDAKPLMEQVQNEPVAEAVNE